MASQEELKKRLKVLMNRPENQICSDCPERQPRWASLIVPPPGAPPGTQPIGAFCCLECSGSHRRLGVHISFVRSVNLDSWKEKEVIAMENGGNRKVNAIFEARLPPGAVKLQAGADGPTRERFIRDKYERRKFYNPSAFLTYIPDTVEDCNGVTMADDSPSVRSGKLLSKSNHSQIRPPSDAARQRVESRQSKPTVTPKPAERKVPIPKAPRSAPASFDLLDLSAPPTTTTIIAPAAPAEIVLSQVPAEQPSYAADLLAPVPAVSTTSEVAATTTNGTAEAAKKNSHDHIMALFNTPSPQIMGGGMNPMMMSQPMGPKMGVGMVQQQPQSIGNLMVHPSNSAHNNNLMMMMQQQQQQQQRMIQQQQQQQQVAAGAGFGSNLMVQPKSNPALLYQQHAFHQSFIMSNDGGGYGSSNGYSSDLGSYGGYMGNGTLRTNSMGHSPYVGQQNQMGAMNMMLAQPQQQQQQQQIQQPPAQQPMQAMSSNANMMYNAMLAGSAMAMMSNSSQDESDFPSAPMGSGPPMGIQQPLPTAELPPKPPQKEDPFAQFGMNVFRS